MISNHYSLAKSKMHCKGCNKDKKLVRAHAIPESFFRSLRADAETLFMVPNTQNNRPKRAPIGAYDKEILCKGCEGRFQETDDYAAKILINNSDFEEFKRHEIIAGYRINSVNNDLLKIFVISLLWRASISKLGFYKNVNLGSLEQVAKDLIWNQSPGGKHDFSFVLSKFEDTGTLSKVMLDPYPERWFGRLYYRFYLGGYVLYVKADSQTTPVEWEQFISVDNSLLLISRGKFESSKEYPLLLKMAKNSAKAS